MIRAVCSITPETFLGENLTPFRLTATSVPNGRQGLN